MSNKLRALIIPLIIMSIIIVLVTVIIAYGAENEQQFQYEPVEINTEAAVPAVEQETKEIQRVIVIETEPEIIEATQSEIPQNCYSSVFETMSEDEYNLFVAILYLEAHGQSKKGKIMTAEVILNRVVAEAWPDTIYDVLSQKGQFSTWRSRNKILNNPDIDTSLEIEAIEYLSENGRTYLDNDYVYFATYKANGRDFIYESGHYYGRGKIN